MELKPGMSALVTGGGAGIGKALCLALAKKGIFITIVDFSEEKGKEVASLVEKENAKFHPDLPFKSAISVKCDVTDAGQLSGAFKKHFETYGGLDICINSAGVLVSKPFHEDQLGSTNPWRHTMNVNLISVIDSTRLAIQTMLAAQKPGVIINLGSSAGLYPMIGDPIYSASKGGVVLFTRSLSLLKRQGIRANVLCPEFVQTDLVSTIPSSFVEKMGGWVSMEAVIKGAFEFISDDSKAGACLWISKRRGLEYWPTPMEEVKYRLPSNSQKPPSVISQLNLQLPKSFEKIVVHTRSHSFRSSTKIVRTPLLLPIKPGHVLVKVIYAGVNASDVNFSGSKKGLASTLPFDVGFEAVGIVAAIGESVDNLKVGTPAALLTFGVYAEFTMVPARHILAVARPDPEVVAILTSGLTASIALEKTANMESGKVVLVTAAAGDTGQFAVQLAKLTGNKVVATCGGKEKANVLTDLGIDRVIDYKSEDIKTVLRNEYPKGVDIVYESTGGHMFDLCLNSLAIHGKMVVIGLIPQYQEQHGWKPLNYVLSEKILFKSQTVAGFFLVQYSHLWQQHLDKLLLLHSLGKLKILLDPKNFIGLNSVADAVEYLRAGTSVGKVVVCLDPSFTQNVAKL